LRSSGAVPLQHSPLATASAVGGPTAMRASVLSSYGTGSPPDLRIRTLVGSAKHGAADDHLHQHCPFGAAFIMMRHSGPRSRMSGACPKLALPRCAPAYGRKGVPGPAAESDRPTDPRMPSDMASKARRQPLPLRSRFVSAGLLWQTRCHHAVRGGQWSSATGRSKWA
jgi:hypothetical protein